MNWAALLPVVLIATAFLVYCLLDIAKNDVRHLPKWAWIAVCLLSIPLGGIVYLLVGRSHGETG